MAAWLETVQMVKTSAAWQIVMKRQCGFQLEDREQNLLLGGAGDESCDTRWLWVS